MCRRKAEYGGFLPLELNKGHELFDYIDEADISRYNSGTTALYASIMSLGLKKVRAPYFYCPSVWAEFNADRFTEIEFIPYYVDKELLPIVEDFDDSTEGIILVNYYGIMDNVIRRYARNKKNIIIDNAQAFFCPPLIQEKTMNVYSCRKFVGVSDGAYVIGNNQFIPDFEVSSSIDNFGFLYKSIELGTNEVYQENLKSSDKLNREYMFMSLITRAILKNADYDNIRHKRVENFRFIHKYMQDYQLFDMRDYVEHAYCYPLLLKEDLRQKLIDNRIYVPTLWREMIVPEFEGSIEYDMSSRCLCLPIDQRYDIDDMKYICDFVIKNMEA